MTTLARRAGHAARTNWARTVKLIVLGGSVAVLLSGCVAHPLQDSLNPKGTYARLENSLFWPVFWIAVAVFALVFGLVATCIVRFRARSEDEAPRQVHGNTRAELTWTILPALLLAGIAVPTVKFVFDLNKFPANAMTIDVTGHRWWWQMGYTNQTDPSQTLFNTATELHIPVKTKVIIDLTSDDVIHNFWVPQLAGKLYAIPGRHNRMVLESDDVGTFYGQCAEFCGTSHANMRLRVIVQSQDDFATWMANQESGPNLPAVNASANVAAGFNDFKVIGCAGCHTMQGVSVGVVGPDLTHFASRSTFAGSIFANTDANLALWLANPPKEKPGSVMPNLHLSASQISQLIAFLDTLK